MDLLRNRIIASFFVIFCFVLFYFFGSSISLLRYSIILRRSSLSAILKNGQISCGFFFLFLLTAFTFFLGHRGPTE